QMDVAVDEALREESAAGIRLLAAGRELRGDRGDPAAVDAELPEAVPAAETGVANHMLHTLTRWLLVGQTYRRDPAARGSRRCRLDAKPSPNGRGSPDACPGRECTHSSASLGEGEWMRTLRVATDIGGTFTALVAYDETSEQPFVAKTPSTPPVFIEGVLKALEKAGIAPEEVAYLKHGSTIATNAIIERRGAKAGLVTTRGLRDVLAAGRANRPDMFKSNCGPSPPLIPTLNA